MGANKGSSFVQSGRKLAPADWSFPFLFPFLLRWWLSWLFWIVRPPDVLDMIYIFGFFRYLPFLFLSFLFFFFSHVEKGSLFLPPPLGKNSSPSSSSFTSLFLRPHFLLYVFRALSIPPFLFFPETYPSLLPTLPYPSLLFFRNLLLVSFSWSALSVSSKAGFAFSRLTLFMNLLEIRFPALFSQSYLIRFFLAGFSSALLESFHNFPPHSFWIDALLNGASFR